MVLQLVPQKTLTIIYGHSRTPTHAPTHPPSDSAHTHAHACAPDTGTHARAHTYICCISNARTRAPPTLSKVIVFIVVLVAVAHRRKADRRGRQLHTLPDRERGRCHSQRRVRSNIAAPCCPSWGRDRL